MQKNEPLNSAKMHIVVIASHRTPHAATFWFCGVEGCSDGGKLISIINITYYYIYYNIYNNI